MKNQVFINSLDLAKVFKKRHDNIIQTIENLPQDEFKTLNFEISSSIRKNGLFEKDTKFYKLTRDAFSLLVMGFTGEKAYKWKILFIKAFNEMEKRLKNLEQEKMQKLAFRQSLGYKSQLKQQKEHYENKIKALKYDLEKKKQLSFKRKLSEKELLELRKILAKDYDILCFKKWEMSLVAEKIGKDTVFEAVLNKLEKELNYWQNYEEYEEKWKKILRR
ncbi:Rha family transcriptional regulator [Campylobacter coli]|nr:phage antirepressor Ant [Campylobacter coli]ECO1946636.1 Rha family transcriptional regulator [Campylobacter coli]ECO2091129.1 Rha family transcriptional regulator [Campylobacter coli]